MAKRKAKSIRNSVLSYFDSRKSGNADSYDVKPTEKEKRILNNYSFANRTSIYPDTLKIPKLVFPQPEQTQSVDYRESLEKLADKIQNITNTPLVSKPTIIKEKLIANNFTNQISVPQIIRIPAEKSDTIQKENNNTSVNNNTVVNKYKNISNIMNMNKVKTFKNLNQNSVSNRLKSVNENSTNRTNEYDTTINNTHNKSDTNVNENRKSNQYDKRMTSKIINVNLHSLNNKVDNIIKRKEIKPIPSLAKGGFAGTPTLAVIGDSKDSSGKSEGEMVIQPSKLPNILADAKVMEQTTNIVSSATESLGQNAGLKLQQQITDSSSRSNLQMVPMMLERNKGMNPDQGAGNKDRKGDLGGKGGSFLRGTAGMPVWRQTMG